MPAPESLKTGVARTLKWNVIDRVSSQVLYAVTGIVLANALPREDFGLVGAILVFQAFASLFVDSGFSSALIQASDPDEKDYSTVFWFNLLMACGLYAVLFFVAPLLPALFKAPPEIVPLARVMFLSFIINAAAIVQANRLMKRMDVRMIAVSNSIGLIVSAGVGIALAVTGFGAWAIVWQTITLAVVKTAILWLTGHWRPLWILSRQSLGKFFKVGSGVMISSFLNTVFQNIYSFFIGNQVGMTALGYYSQADKWSKMPTASLSQVLTASFLPALSRVRPEPERFVAALAKMSRCTAYLLFPAMTLLIVMAEPIFHLLFGTKWDGAIVLFQILCLRGIFTVLQSLYNNYILSVGEARLLVITEIMRDAAAVAAILITIPYIGLSTPADVTLGIAIFLWGQLAASVITWAVTLYLTARVTPRSAIAYLADLLPYIILSAVAVAPAWLIGRMAFAPALALLLQGVTSLALYTGICALTGSRIQRDALAYLRGK
ncbi:MAG: lipopolysaccharide biosynthesis protein [Duncaniella sp.]|nr:lipopolysaccharide biosynthesis protein [Duncaniella sp.]